MRKEKNKKYTFDFYALTHDSEDLFSVSVADALRGIMDKDYASEHHHYGCTREIYDLCHRSNPDSYAGQIRKIRKADLPEVGQPGRDSKKLELDEDEGVVEKNFFVYYCDNSTLVIHRNENGNTGTHLAQLLSSSLGTPYFASPLIRPEDAELILNNKLTIKKFSVKIPRPTNPDLYPQDSISATTVELLNKSGADSLDLTFTVDSKLDSSSGRLTSALQTAISTLLSLGATKAKLETDDNGLIHPIDLIANRITSTQSTRTNAHFPPSETMYKLIDAARMEKKEEVDGYFGKNQRLV